MDLSKEGIKPLKVHLSALGAIEHTMPNRQDRAHLHKVRLAKNEHSCARAQDRDRVHASLARFTLAAIASHLRCGVFGAVMRD